MKKIDETSSLQKSYTDLEKERASASVNLELEVMMMQCYEWKRKYEQLLLASTCKAQDIKH